MRSIATIQTVLKVRLQGRVLGIFFQGYGPWTWTWTWRHEAATLRGSKRRQHLPFHFPNLGLSMCSRAQLSHSLCTSHNHTYTVSHNPTPRSLTSDKLHNPCPRCFSFAPSWRSWRPGLKRTTRTERNSPSRWGWSRSGSKSSCPASNCSPADGTQLVRSKTWTGR